jgi:Rrf2 family protein
MSEVVIISEAVTLALHGMGLLRKGKRMSAKDMAASLDVSEAHLAKVFQRLVRAGLVRSTRGPSGGFDLVKDPADISLLDIFVAIEGGVPVGRHCILGNQDNCPFDECVLGGLLKRMTNEFVEHMGKTCLDLPEKRDGEKKSVLRKIVTIDEEKCDGCGQCVDACHEGAIAMVDGKAKLVNNICCDGLGDCIGKCPQGAITFEERIEEPYDEEAVRRQGGLSLRLSGLHGEGSPRRGLHREEDRKSRSGPVPGLANWPVQIRLVPVDAPYLKNAELVVAADCTSLALPEFHRMFLAGGEKVCLMGCPKLDDAQEYAEKLTDIIRENRIASVTEVRMEVPCCSGLTRILEKACADAGRGVSLKVFTVGVQGGIVDKETIRFTHG